MTASPVCLAKTPNSASVFPSISVNNVSRSFGKDAGYTVGLFFLPWVFASMLSYGQARYWGPSYVDPSFAYRGYPQPATTSSRTASSTRSLAATRDQVHPAAAPKAGRERNSGALRGVVAGMTSYVAATAFGGPEALSVLNETLGEPGPGEVRLRVHAVGTNPVDFKVYSGAYGRDDARLPLRIGSEAAGTVTAVGPEAVGPAGPISVGDEVIVFRAPGAYAEELLVPAGAVLPKPATLDWNQAAGLMLTGVTATHALAATAVGARDTVLIHGGAGGVGIMAIQLAAGRGATVVATASPANHALLAELGAIPVAYGPGLADRVRAAAPGGVDAALDLVGTDEALDVSLELVADRDRIATIAGFSRGFGAGIKVLGGAPGADNGAAIRDAARLELVRLTEAGALTVHVQQTFPLAEAAAAHRLLMDGHGAGKVILVP